MKIFTLDYNPSSRLGGQELSLVDESVGLARAGHGVTLGHVVEGDLLDRYRAAGVEALRLSEIEVRPGSRVQSTLSVAASALRAAAARPEVVAVNQYHDTLFGAAVAQLSRAPLVCHLRLLPPVEMCAQWRLGLPNVTRFVAASQSIADAWVRERGCDPATISVAHDGLDTDIYAPRPEARARVRSALGIGPDAFVILSVGRIDRVKNLETLIRSFAGLGLAATEARLLIVGGPVSHATEDSGEEYVGSLRRLAGSFGVGASTQFLGRRADIVDLLAASDVSTMFSFYEPLGRVTFEALACGRPVIAARGGGTDEILTGEFAALRFDATDHVAATALLRSLMGWQRRDPDFATRARQHAVARFSISSKVRACEHAFSRAIAERGRRGPRGAALRTVNRNAVAFTGLSTK